MDNLFTGVQSEWFQESKDKVAEINKKRNRKNFVSFSRKSWPFRIDEIMINLKTEEKIHVEHRKGEEPIIYAKEMN